MDIPNIMMRERFIGIMSYLVMYSNTQQGYLWLAPNSHTHTHTRTNTHAHKHTHTNKTHTHAQV